MFRKEEALKEKEMMEAEKFKVKLFRKILAAVDFSKTQKGLFK